MGKRKREKAECSAASAATAPESSTQDVVESEQTAVEPEDNFDAFGLDDRIMKAIGRLGWGRPTSVQSAFIPLALEGKDVIARARTGSGKTAAFLLPIIQRLLELKGAGASAAGVGATSVKCLALAPTKELSRQIAEHAAALCSCTARAIKVVDLAAHSDVNAQKCLLASGPDIVACTPSRIVAHLKSDPGILKALRFLVMDEADLLFSFGFENDLKEIKGCLPSTYQAFLTSATMNDHVKALKKLVLRRPVTLRLEESALPPVTQLTQFHVRLEEEDKFTLLYALLKLKLLRGKSIVFVKDTDRCYQYVWEWSRIGHRPTSHVNPLDIYTHQFGVPACVLNSEMPLNSRCHVVHQFNQDEYEYIIASDENDPVANAPPIVDQVGNGETEGEKEKTVDEESQQKVAKPKKRRRDRESGAARGIDFQRVSNVVNFDIPHSVDAYIHRVGRTARGANKGTAISFATMAEAPILEEIISAVAENMGSDAIRPYQFRMDELDGFRYRARDMLRAVTSSAIRETRLGEIRAELIRSKQLDGYFAKNGRELAALRHDKVLHASIKCKPQLVHVPQYIVPSALRPTYKEDLNKVSKKKRKNAGNYGGVQKPTRQQQKFAKNKNDPLKSFSL